MCELRAVGWLWADQRMLWAACRKEQQHRAAACWAQLRVSRTSRARREQRQDRLHGQHGIGRRVAHPAELWAAHRMLWAACRQRNDCSLRPMARSVASSVHTAAVTVYLAKLRMYGFTDCKLVKINKAARCFGLSVETEQEAPSLVRQFGRVPRSCLHPRALARASREARLCPRDSGVNTAL